MLFHAPDLAEQINDWKFIELWVEPIIFPPQILMLVSGKNRGICIYDPSISGVLRKLLH